MGESSVGHSVNRAKLNNRRPSNVVSSMLDKNSKSRYK